MSAAGAETLLAMSGISKSYAGVRALRDVSFDLVRGEVHALVGENGAGKSTLMRTLTGAVRPDAGTIDVDGRRVDLVDPAMSRALGIRAIYQQPALFPDLSVSENIALGLESKRAWQRVRWSARHARARALLDRIGADIDPETEVRRLSMPEQQLVEIARAIGADARILIMDEPTASLSGAEVEKLFRVIRELRAGGTGIVYVSHRLEELPLVADRVTALRDGALVGTHRMAHVGRAELIRMMVGREISAVFPARHVEPGPTRFEVRGLSSRADGIRDVSFDVRAGEILGLAGLVGAGRTEVARLLFGLAPRDSGTIRLDGRAIDIRTPAEAVAHGIAFVPEDRRRHGVILEMSVADNTTLAVLRRISSRGWLDSAREAALAAEYVVRLGVKTPSIDVPAGSLSGGNQQKVALARWLATDPKVLLLDEPTQGIDVGAKSEIHRLMGDLAARGLAIVMISSELPEILGMSDRIAVMHAGRIVAIVDRAGATQESILALALGQPADAAAAAGGSR